MKPHRILIPAFWTISGVALAQFTPPAGGSGSGTVNSGTTGQVAAYTGSGTTVGGVGPGTATTVLHGNASGQPSYGAVSLTGDVTGILSASRGGGLVLLDSQTLAEAAATVTFSTISGSYKNLLITAITRGDTAATTIDLRCRLNSDTGSNYAFDYILDAGGTVSGGANASQTSFFMTNITAASSAANIPSCLRCSVVGYSQTTFAKGIISWCNAQNNASFTQNTGRQLLLTSGFWNNTAAVTTVLLYPSAGNFVAGSVFNLYGEA